MFTGLVEEMGILRAVRRGAHSSVLSIGADRILDKLRVGDSVAVNGVCLTATSLDDGGFTADVMHETLDRSSLAGLAPGDKVNLERAMAVGGRFGGHIVSGHVDACGEVVSMTGDGIAILMKISAPQEVLRYVAVKGSVTVDGVSLTVAGADDMCLTVSIIPHTAENTTLGRLHPGATVNLEVDMLARYVERLMNFPADSGKKNGGGLTLDFLAENGF